MNTQYTRYTKTISEGRNLVIDLIRLPAGYAISHAVESFEIENPPKCSDGFKNGIGMYKGGWSLYPRLYKTLSGAERALTKGGWTKD